jgi:hypothetical protein
MRERWRPSSDVDLHLDNSKDGMRYQIPDIELNPSKVIHNVSMSASKGEVAMERNGCNSIR